MLPRPLPQINMNFSQNIFGISRALAQTADKTTNLATDTANNFQSLFDSFFKAIPLWITGIIVVLASFIVAKLVKNLVENKMTEQGLEESHQEVQIVIARSVYAGVLGIGITIGLKIAGIDLTGVVAAAAFGIGFAMRDFLMNFFAGIVILLQKQFTIGDWIKIGGTMGIIEKIQSRYTVVKNFDGTRVIIPNADLFSKQVTSMTYAPLRRFQFELSVHLDYDLHEVIDLIKTSIKKVNKILLEPKPSVVVLPPGNSHNTLRIRCWVDSKKGILTPQSDLIKQLHKDFYARGWSWPYPTQNIILDNNLTAAIKQEEKLVQAQEKILAKVEEKTAAPISAIAVPEVQTVNLQASSASPSVAPVIVPEIQPQAKEVSSTILPLPEQIAQDSI